jgi:hypothetical protein
MRSDGAHNIIPEQEEGNQSDIVEKINAENEEKAKLIFNEAKKRLLAVNSWKEISGDILASFTLVDKSGEKINHGAQVGDYFKIDIPGPGTKSGEGYDWVRVEAIEDHSNAFAEKESFGIRVRPAANPEKDGNEKETAHFFKDEATSNFIIERNGRRVSAGVHGRNEKPNTTTNKIVDKVRNAVIGSTAILGISNLQWKKLVKGLIWKKSV